MNDRENAEFSDELDLLLGRTIDGRFRLDRVVSQSSASTLYAGVDETSSTSVNLRLFTAEATRTSGGAIAERAEKVGALDHRSITPVVAVGTTDVDGSPRWYVASTRPAGGTLQDMLDRGRRLSPSQAVVVGVAICRALDRAHRAGLVHLDLRPSAIAFDNDREASLSDIGVVSAIAERAWETPNDVSMERARYASPEQAAERSVDEKTDVYALALVLSEAITGAVPFLADSVVATLSARHDRLFPVSADLGPLATVLERAGRFDPEQRFGAADFGRALVQAAGSLPRPTPPPVVFDDATGEVVRPDVEPAASTEGRDALVETETHHDVTVEPTNSAAHPRVGRWVAAAVAVLALVVGGFFVYRSVSEDSERIPVLVGLDEGEATNAVTKYGWRVETIEEFDDAIAVGKVVRTEPESGTSLARDGVLVLVLSSGPPPVPLPDIVGVSADEAAAQLASLGLEIRREDGYSEEVPAGSIARWAVTSQPNLVAGDEVVKGTVVDVIVSTGPEPRVVPELRGQTADAAEGVLADLKLRIRRVEDQYFTDVPVGQIGFQVPPPGELAERDSEVTVVVSKGPDVVTVPVLERMNHGQVVQALTDAGLVVGTITGNTGGILVAILVEGRPVTSGQVVARGTVVELAYFGS
ncbi:MAG: PASTA domain-containing protein [Actinomycetota bacterium]|nr:PASTA domain-containing protein [Actinomycetota bacterium]MDA3012275.1 PASTA domain-containing protein [Actinomycetota bacterium]MDA3025116.1 PASTA domain-containing protein [Actinomycetota bacterium]